MKMERVGQYDILLASKKERKITDLLSTGKEPRGPQTYEFKAKAPTLAEIKRELE